MFDNYLKKILPIPITKIKRSDDGYKYEIMTYSSVLNEYGVENLIRKITSKNKRIKSFDGWYLVPNNFCYKEAIVEFER